MSRTSFLARRRASVPSTRRRPRASARAAAVAVVALVAPVAPLVVPSAASAAPAAGGGVHASAAQAGGFVPLAAPQRLLDTRTSGGCVTTTRDLQVTGVAGVPSGAAAVALNVAAVGATAAGFLRTYPADQAQPATSTMNYQAVQGISNAVVAKPSASGVVRFQAMAGTCPHVVVDVTGYFTSGAAAAGGYVAPATPQRVLDTRSGGGACLSTTRALQLGGVSGIPADASSVFVNVAAVTPVAAGTLRLMPSDADFTSGVNMTYNAGLNVSTSSAVKPGADGAVNVAVSGGCTHVVVDVVGWTKSGSAGIGGVVPVASRRIMDTRPAGAGGCVTTPRELVVSPFEPDTGGVPSGAGSVLLAVTATGAATAGFGRVYPGGTTEPAASTINYQAGSSITNLVMARIGSGGAVMFSAQGGSCPHLIVELLGYTVGDPATAAAAVNYTQAAVSRDLSHQYGHSCAVASGGVVRCWGDNSYGELGNGTRTASAAPTAVTLLAATTQVSAGITHTCARLSSGGVSCWGSNATGQLGVGTTVSSDVPRALFIANVSNVSVGDFHTCARISDGGVRCWGENGYGQLGDGSTVYRLAPVAVSISGALSVTSGGTFSCSPVTGGSVKCWGSNQWGSLGTGPVYGELRDSSVPVTVAGVTGATQVSAGDRHACALLSGGTVKCWGDAALGDGSATGSSTPVSVSGVSGAVEVTAGSGWSCARLADTSVKCWGDLVGSTLLNPTTVASLVGAGQVVGGDSPCIVRAGRVSCLALGDDDFDSRLGRGSFSWTSDAVRVPVAAATQLVAGTAHTCALVAGGAVKCWGGNYQRQLGDGTTTSTESAVDVGGVSGATQLAAGAEHTCALLSGGTVRCWGANNVGQLGDGTLATRTTAVTVTGVSGATQVVAGAFHTCALLSGGTAKCWGLNSYSQTMGATTYSGTPSDVTGLSGATRLGAAADTSCALVSSAVRCWGQVPGTIYTQGSPTLVAGTTGATSLTSGFSAEKFCVTVSSNVSCWGLLQNQYGILTGYTSPQVMAGFTGATSVSVSREQVCGVVAGSVRCWGSNRRGQLGDRTSVGRFIGTAPSSVLGVSGVTQVVLGEAHACALSSGLVAGSVRCWGVRSSGRLGVGLPAPMVGLYRVVN